MSKKKTVQMLAGAAAVIGISAFTYYLIKKKYPILEEQDVKLSDFHPETVEQFLLEDQNHDNALRLNRAYEFLPKDHDLSGFIAFTTFERHLREIAKHTMPNAKKSPGLRNLAGRLRSLKIISRETYEKIKEYTIEVRNPLIHGSGVYCPNKLKDSLEFIREFMNDYPLSRFKNA